MASWEDIVIIQVRGKEPRIGWHLPKSRRLDVTGIQEGESSRFSSQLRSQVYLQGFEPRWGDGGALNKAEK